MTNAYLLLASEVYSLPILRPLAAAAQRRGARVAWLCSDAMAARLGDGEPRIDSAAALRQFGADAVFSTVHRIPPQLPGKQVQLFHGLNVDKRDPARGHFRVRGLFDLYCTHGPATTAPFQALAREHGDFAVEETGWPKLDPLFADPTPSPWLRAAAHGRPVAMYASTFTTSLSSAADFLPTLTDLVARGDRYWLLTLHPKSPPALIARYRLLAGANAQYLEGDHMLDMLRAADVLVCDTSSVIEEFALLYKPVVTLRTRRPRPFMVDVAEPAAVDAAIDLALGRPAPQMQAMADYAAQIHPARDGHASERVLDAVERLLAGGYALAPRRVGLWRRWQARKTLRSLLPRP